MKESTVSDVSAEQQARDMLERIGVENAQSFTAGDLVELANLISQRERLRSLLAYAVQEAEDWHDECRGRPLQDERLSEARALLRTA